MSPDKELVNFDGILTKDERERILNRCNSLLFWVGTPVPSEEIIDGKTIELREIIYDFLSAEELTAEQLVIAERLVGALQEKATTLKEIIAVGDITEEDAIAHMREVCGLLRAVDDLKSLEDEKNLKKKELLERVDDEKRWMRFLDTFGVRGK